MGLQLSCSSGLNGSPANFTDLFKYMYLRLFIKGIKGINQTMSNAGFLVMATTGL